MPFSKLIGNDPTQSALTRLVQQNSVPNTLLFSGPDGIGKSLFAVALAELLMGEKHAPKLASRNHPDLHIYYPEGKSAIHTIENIRKIIDEVALPPYEAPVKVFILHDAHQMLPASSNALLKILEEPPLHCYFILLTSSPESILPTITSRCRKIPFFAIPQAQIETLLIQEWEKKPEDARRIAFLSHGSLSKAKQLSEHSKLPWREPLLEILSLDLPADYPQFHKLVRELEESCASDAEEEDAPVGQADAIYEEIVAWYRDLHLIKEEIALEQLYHLDSIERLKLTASKPLVPLEKILEQTMKSRLALQRNVALKNVLEQFFLSL